MVLDDLHCGNIYTGELLNEMEKLLSKGQMDLVKQFHTHVINVHCMEVEAQFQYGFSLGAMLMKEVYELSKSNKDNHCNTYRPGIANHSPIEINNSVVPKTEYVPERVPRDLKLPSWIQTKDASGLR